MTEGAFPIVEQIRQAPSKRAIAQILLRLSDTVVMSHGDVLMAECRAQRFTEAAQYLVMRQTSLNAVRDKSGRLPDAAAIPLENWRTAFAAFAQSSPQ